MPAFGGEDAESYYDEGLTASVKGDVTRAARFFNKAARLDKSFLAARHQLAKCYLRVGNAEQAVAMLRDVVAAKPELIPAKLDLGSALLSLGYPEEARKQFLEVAEKQPSNSRANVGLATVCFQEGNWDGAVTLAQEARVKAGDHFATLYLLGRAARLAGAVPLSSSVLEQADKLLEKTIEMNPEQPEGHFLRGEVAFVLEQFTKAIRYYRAADELAKTGRVYSAWGEFFGRSDIRAKWGLCLQHLGKTDMARELGRRILKEDRKHKIGRALADL